MPKLTKEAWDQQRIIKALKRALSLAENAPVDDDTASHLEQALDLAEDGQYTSALPHLQTAMESLEKMLDGGLQDSDDAFHDMRTEVAYALSVVQRIEDEPQEMAMAKSIHKAGSDPSPVMSALSALIDAVGMMVQPDDQAKLSQASAALKPAPEPTQKPATTPTAPLQTQPATPPQGQVPKVVA